MGGLEGTNERRLLRSMMIAIALAATMKPVIKSARCKPRECSGTTCDLATRRVDAG